VVTIEDCRLGKCSLCDLINKKQNQTSFLSIDAKKALKVEKTVHLRNVVNERTAYVNRQAEAFKNPEHFGSIIFNYIKCSHTPFLTPKPNLLLLSPN